MKPLILVVDDNEDILFNLKLTLENFEYEVITAKSGEHAIKLLVNLETSPNIIISDIMMPKMNGFEFFKQISSDPRWAEIPFLFLSAKSSIEDVRFGKMLGADDYLTKPIIEDDLIASIKGKINRSNNINSINAKISELLKKYEIIPDLSIMNGEKENVTLFYMVWDDIYGPRLKDFYSIKEKIPYSLQKTGVQLFNAAVLIYGQENVLKAEGILLNIKYIDMQAFLYFDSNPDENQRSGQKQYMLAVIAPKINYFKSLQIKEVLQEAFLMISESNEWSIKEYTEKISKILNAKLF
ncbi:MAG: PleD family two-component system response regulator [Promethearchaeota archaeon]